MFAEALVPVSQPNDGWGSHLFGPLAPRSDINATVDAFHYSDANGNMIDWDPATMTLQIQGIIEFDSKAHIGEGNDG